MRQLRALCLAIVGFPVLHAQNNAHALPPIPKDPLAILKAAAPLYAFNDPQLKPWHLKGTYQLYNENGGLGDKGAGVAAFLVGLLLSFVYPGARNGAFVAVSLAAVLNANCHLLWIAPSDFSILQSEIERAT